MEESIVKYIKTLPKKKQRQIVLLLEALKDPSDEKKCMELESSGFDFDDWKRLQSNVFQIVFTGGLIDKIILRV